MKTVKRTFEALKYPKGSAERERLNQDWLTSEYMPSHRYGVRNDDGSHTPFTYRTKSEADRRAQLRRFRCVQKVDMKQKKDYESLYHDALSRLSDVVSVKSELASALEGIFEHCVMVHKHWGDGSNARQSDDAQERARAILDKIKGE